MSEYGIVANIAETDKFARTGSKAYLVGGTGGEGRERMQWLVRTRNGSLAIKWLPTGRLSNFRPAWIPDHVQEAAGGSLYISGTKEEMQKAADELRGEA